MTSVSSEPAPQSGIRTLGATATRALRRGLELARPNRGVPDDLALVGGPFEQVETPAGPLWVLAADQVMRPYLRDRGHWQHPTDTLLASLLRPGARFLHIGAEVGYLSLQASRMADGVQVAAVEPNPLLFPLLRANAWANGIDAQLWNGALGNDRGMIPVDWPDDDPADCHFGVGGVGRAGRAVVPILPADDLLNGQSFDVVVVRSRGWESDVVFGMRGIIQRSPGIVIVTDFWPSVIRDRGLEPQAVVDRFLALGFDAAVHDSWGLGHCALEEVVAHCNSAGPTGRVHLVLRKRR